MTASEIRQQFLKFFESKGHQVVPSAPIVVKNDPTLMFTNAGMNQFKDYFLGNEKAPHVRVADTQKCLRVSGKHNDLEEVGVDTYHHTMFEMLGNWSFGDYFKAEAIAWAWELLTDVYKLDKDRLYITVFEGSKEEGLAFDEEAYQEWLKLVPESRIIKASKKDNFWEMGDTGPCGPSSEIHIDLRSAQEIADGPSGKVLVNQDHPQVIEIWNLVFIEFNRLVNGSLTPLPAKHVDTGMGFERLVRAMKLQASNYDSDVFQPLIQTIAQQAKVTYGKDEATDIAIRVIADHIRAIAFCIADGQLPSNTGAGYVVRRILRRAVRYGYSFLNFKAPFLVDLVGQLAEQFQNVFPELHQQVDFVQKVIKEEEVAFLRTLENGIKRFHEKASAGKTLSGADAFELYDTFGFPIDLTELLAREEQLEVDKAGFETHLAQQKERSRKAAAVDTDDWVELLSQETTMFLGYDQLEAQTKIVRYRKVKAKGKEQYQLVFEQTPFYPEGGGQVGDTGWLSNANERLPIIDTKKENNLIIHLAPKLPANLEAEFSAQVDADKRARTANNHSATHLLHAALRQVLGTHVEQRGSLVNDQYLRFDFSHFSAVTPEELQAIEQMVNQKVRENIILNEAREIPIEEAKARGAMALFGEKYGDKVRMITFDPKYSIELCGGTHIPATGHIGLFKITSESAVAAGVRRIEAITAEAAEQRVSDFESTIQQLSHTLKTPNVVKAVEAMLEEQSQLQKKLETLEGAQVQQVKQKLKDQVIAMDGVNLLAAMVEVPNANSLKDLSFQLRNETENLFLVLGAVVNSKPLLSVMIADNLVKDRDYHAGKIVKELAKQIRGGGGGQPFYATAGGSQPEGLAEAIKLAESFLQQSQA